jgi:hypothetical protein
MAYERNGKGGLVHVPDAINLNKKNPAIVRQIVEVLIKHQDDIARPGLRAVYVMLEDRPVPTLRLSFELQD